MRLTQYGTVWRWGGSPYGRLGFNTSSESRVPIQVIGTTGASNTTLSGVTQFVHGYYSFHALLDTTEVVNWGHGSNGTMGNNSTSNRLYPVKPKTTDGTGALSGISAIAAGHYHVCLQLLCPQK